MSWCDILQMITIPHPPLRHPNYRKGCTFVVQYRVTNYYKTIKILFKCVYSIFIQYSFNISISTIFYFIRKTMKFIIIFDRVRSLAAYFAFAIPRSLFYLDFFSLLLLGDFTSSVQFLLFCRFLFVILWQRKVVNFFRH